MKVKSIGDGFMPWAGLALGTLGYFLAHQLGSDATFQDCTVGSPLIVFLGAVIGLAVIGLGALGSWSIYTARDETPGRRLVAIVGLMACGIYVIGVTLAVIAALVIPPCWA